MRTHTFRHGKYDIEEANGLYGLCDVPSDSKKLRMIVLEGNTRLALNNSIHEMMHAEGVPDGLVHDMTPDRIADALWRMGWRRCEI